ncbi:hypothetical protein PRUB_a1155 [Pseudoalteromonas rubra]|uniref:DUF4124 domain-containing protein n=1 Tax=Pseudoalteromonas rubra TaxID=43658 RepID=A0A8T0C795_9GAMM|nr:DUF4124 domain-containing protein [Pseudoalteromonas rubra]KAF7786549.1 hypothetical protein PRUB_a1155 [Pseudoalteromonas rubra]
MKILIIMFWLLWPTLSQAKTTFSYYKCVTGKTVVYSQHPCAANAEQHTLSHSNPQAPAPTGQHTKTLNNIERQQLVLRLKKTLRAKKHQAAILGRKRDEATRDEQRRISRMMEKSERAKTLKDVKRNIKSINTAYLKEVKLLNKEIASLEKRLKRLE